MSNIEPHTAQVVADPKRPWKAAAAFVGTFIVALWQALEGKEDTVANMTWVELLLVVLGALAVSILTYSVRNPKIVKETP